MSSRVTTGDGWRLVDGDQADQPQTFYAPTRRITRPPEIPIAEDPLEVAEASELLNSDEPTDEEWEAMAEAAYADDMVCSGVPWL